MDSSDRLQLGNSRNHMEEEFGFRFPVSVTTGLVVNHLHIVVNENAHKPEKGSSGTVGGCRASGHSLRGSKLNGPAHPNRSFHVV